jgi:hypothetical protein
MANRRTQEWAHGRSTVFRAPPPYAPFPSFPCFALFVQARLLSASPTAKARAPERSFGNIHRPSEAQRRDFFALTRRWLDRLFDACPGGGAALRDELHGLLAPLPVDDPQSGP